MPNIAEEVRTLRQDVDELIKKALRLESSREVALVITKLQEAKFWVQAEGDKILSGAPEVAAPPVAVDVKPADAAAPTDVAVQDSTEAAPAEGAQPTEGVS